MKISTEIQSTAKIIGEEKAVELIAKAGFDAWDFSLGSMCSYDWQTRSVRQSDHPLAGNKAIEFAKKLKKIGLDNGVVCNQSHAPFPTGCEGIRAKLQLAIECTAEAGGKICVIHPDNNQDAQGNAEMYLKLLPFAKSCGVKIATENMWDWDNEKNQAAPAVCSSPQSFLEHLDAVNDEYFVACLDVGHAEMKGLNTNSVEMIHALSGKLQALHLHDNDLWHDSHQIPFSMRMDFEGIVKALKEIGYQGDFTLEADAYLGRYDKNTVFEGIKNLAESAKKLRDLYLR